MLRPGFFYLHYLLRWIPKDAAFDAVVDVNGTKAASFVLLSKPVFLAMVVLIQMVGYAGLWVFQFLLH